MHIEIQETSTMFIHSHFMRSVSVRQKKRKSLEKCRARCLIIIYISMAKTVKKKKKMRRLSQIIYDHFRASFSLFLYKHILYVL